MKKLHIFFLLVLPAALVFTAALLHYVQGPYWIGHNSDPEYVILINSLALAESKETSINVHPGTTLHILGAATLKISHALAFSEKESLEISVLKNPEFYLTAINIVLITFNAILLFIIGLTALKLAKNIWLSLLLQFSPFFFNVTFTQGLSRVSPEPLLLFASLLFLLILMKMVFKEKLYESAHWYMIVLALVSGFGMATKVTFAPLLIIPFFVLPKFRNKICFLFLTSLSFILWTWPVLSQYNILFNWYYRILTHTGYYGLGSMGIINTETYFRNMIYMFLVDPLFFLIWIFSAGFILVFGWLRWDRATKKSVWQDTSFKILAALVVAQLCSILITAKHPPIRNLLPFINLAGFTLFLIFVYLQRMDYLNHLNIKKVIIVVSLFFILSSAWRIVEIKNVLLQNFQIKQESLDLYSRLENEYKNCLKIYYFHPLLFSSSPVSALAFGNFFITKGLYSETLQKIYGEAYFYSLWSGNFTTWTKGLSIEDIIAKAPGNKVIIYGPPNSNKIKICMTDSNLYSRMRGWSIEDVSVNGHGDKILCRTSSFLNLKDVFNGTYATIYIIEGITTSAGKFQPLNHFSFHDIPHPY